MSNTIDLCVLTGMHWSMRRYITVFHRNKMYDVEEAPQFSVTFYVVLFSKDFK